jgi:hypothetical protein
VKQLAVVRLHSLTERKLLEMCLHMLEIHIILYFWLAMFPAAWRKF